MPRRRKNSLNTKASPHQMKFLINFFSTHTHTGLLTCLMKEYHNVNFIEKDLRFKLNHMLGKLYKLNLSLKQLTPDEKSLWLPFDVSDIIFF